MKSTSHIGLAIAAIAMAVPAQAATDYLLEIGGVEGEASETAPVASWSFGVCSSDQCNSSSTRKEVSSAPALPKSTLTASQNSQSLREAPTRGTKGRTDAAIGASAGATAPVAVTGDLDGDGDGDARSDLAYAAQRAEISRLTFVFAKSSPVLAKVCAGKHIAKATLRGASENFDILDAAVTCSLQGVSQPRTDAGGGRISTNVSVPKQTQGSTFGERRTEGVSPTEVPVTMTISGGQMRHVKTGHVTLLK